MNLKTERSGGSGGGGLVRSAESDIDVAAGAEKEYQRMKRQYFLMQKNRQSLSGKAGSRMSVKSSRLIKTLEKVKEDLDSSISAASSPSNLRKDEVTKEKIWKLLQSYEKYKTQATSLNREIADMERTLVKMTSKFYKAKLVIQGKLGEATPIGRLERTIDNHENKLHLIKSGYDNIMTKNRILKGEIGVRIQRRFFIFQRLNGLHTRMSELRNDLNSKVDESLQVYNLWDDAHKKVNFIKETYKEEVRQHILEVKEYDRLLFHDLREIRFYSTKNRPRSLIEDEAQKNVQKSQKEIDKLLKEARYYQKQFKRLEQFDKSQNVDSIISQYQNLEQKKFTDFIRISDLDKGNTQLMEEILELRREVDTLAADNALRTYTNDEDILSSQLNRDAEQDKLDRLKSQLGVSDEGIQRIVDSVQAFTETAECDIGPLKEILGNRVGGKVTKENLKVAFNLLEHHIASIQLERELLVIQNSVETKTPAEVSGGGGGAGGKAPKQHSSQGGPFDCTLMVSGHSELGMEMKDDQQDMSFGVMPISKAVHREQLVAQLRETGVIASPKAHEVASESTMSLEGVAVDGSKQDKAGKKEEQTKGPAEVDTDTEGEGETETDSDTKAHEDRRVKFDLPDSVTGTDTDSGEEQSFTESEKSEK